MAQTAKLFIITALLTAAACATSYTGRKQLMLLPDDKMNAMGVQAFDQMKTETPIEKDTSVNAYVQCVAGAIAAETQGQLKVDKWEIVVFNDKQVNAFALPGGKIGVYTGILAVANTAGELGAVLGHEVGHVIARHGNERASTAIATEGGLSVVDGFLSTGQYGDVVHGLLGTGAQVGILLPHSRTQESEADLIGIDLMARAGFNPEEAVALWQNMSKAGGQAPPEFLSTHPSNTSRIDNINQHLDGARESYRKAQAAGKRPNCVPPAAAH